MSSGVRRFPPQVAHALQLPSGAVSFTYTAPAGLARRRRDRMSLLETPYQEVLATLSLDARGILLFTRTGSRREGARVASCDVSAMLGTSRWLVSLTWDNERMAVEARPEGGPADT